MIRQKKMEIAFIDTEIDPKNEKVMDIGAVISPIPVESVNGRELHTTDQGQFQTFIKNCFFVCGHNLIDFDLSYIGENVKMAGISNVIDTLYWSPLLFPLKPYHKLLKDDKIQSEELNNPLNDAKKAMELFLDEVTAFEKLSNLRKRIYFTLLESDLHFNGLFRYLKYYDPTRKLKDFILGELNGRICRNADIITLAEENPVELAYCVATIATGDRQSVLPYWVMKRYPKVQEVYHALRNRPCREGCPYCRDMFQARVQLKKKFGFQSFKCYEGEPLQERAAEAAINGKSLLAVFPTGGGKSVTFQLPALIASETVSGLTVVISPLQSLMKDQVDHLAENGIADAVTINGLLNPIERAEALERVESGIASMLYISPESLRSKIIERLLMVRNVVRFVIDEAHCFSSWGQDFRVDYLYIGDFIATLQEKKGVSIPVSCFTATAKQKVISDIREYFQKKLHIELELFTTNAARSNLRYEVLYRETDQEKYATLRELIEQRNCPVICYASRTKAVAQLAERLRGDGLDARAFYGKMPTQEKIANQDAFLHGNVRIMVATSAFGMGVDKKDVGLVVHYDISDSLENYVQEAGRAGRDDTIQAECYVLFNEKDLDKHFILLNQTKLSIHEIGQVWKGIKELTAKRKSVCCSALEIARQAGWDESVYEIETKVRTAISALETSGYVKRGQNCPRVYADSIQVKTVADAITRIDCSQRFDDVQKEHAVRIIKKLISCRSRAATDSGEAESRVDYIADCLGMEKRDVIESVSLMKEEGILANDKEMTVFVEAASLRGHTRKRALSQFTQVEAFLFDRLAQGKTQFQYKQLNEEALESGINASTVSRLKLIVYFWTTKKYVRKPEDEISAGVVLEPLQDVAELKKQFEKRIRLCGFIEHYFMDHAAALTAGQSGEYIAVTFSVQEIQHAYDEEPKLIQEPPVTLWEVEEALLYLSKTNLFRIEGGFLVIYNAMEIKRLEMDNKKRYKAEDYRRLKEFYESRTQQIHIVGEYANMMVRDYNAALAYVNDYFGMDYQLFLKKYFKGARESEIRRNITPTMYHKLFEELSGTQAEVINNDHSGVIVVAAGPGSGKTKLLVHKLGSLMQLEDVKHEQLLMLTFSRAAAMEFKMRLFHLMGNAAKFIEIKTFHSYCFDLLGRVGNLEKSEDIVHNAAQMIRNKEAELDRVTKTVLVLDEAQDMDANAYELVRALMERNEDMRVIAVGDDDQNIYAFRGSDSKYMASFMELPGACRYELLDNYRSSRKIVGIANLFVRTIKERMKTQDIRAVSDEDGEVVVTKTEYWPEWAVVRALERQSGGTAAVLTLTNEQAYLVTEILNRRGIHAKLIQSMDSRFTLGALAEFRYFLGLLAQTQSPVIDSKAWKRAVSRLKEVYCCSEVLDECTALLTKYDEEAGEKKYFHDVEEFLREARLEEFAQIGQGEVFVSTIHKAKGKEFDRVYMLLDEKWDFSDKGRRNIYVGMTRAKRGLYIFYRGAYFEGLQDGIRQMGIPHLYDRTRYPEPDEIMISLTLEDVWLDYAIIHHCAPQIARLRSGDALQCREEGAEGRKRLSFYCVQDGKAYRIARCSTGFYEKKYCLHRKKGYEIDRVKVHFIVHWMNKKTGRETDLVLPLVRMRKGL